jgi:hypothetical protein
MHYSTPGRRMSQHSFCSKSRGALLNVSTTISARNWLALKIHAMLMMMFAYLVCLLFQTRVAPLSPIVTPLLTDMYQVCS